VNSFSRFIARGPHGLASLFFGRSHHAARRTRRGRPPLAAFDQLEPRLAFAVGYATVNDWGSGLQGQLTLTNDTGATLTDWQLTFNYNRDITSIWNATIVSHSGSQYVIKGCDWDRTLAAGAAQGVGFNAGTGSDAPSAFVLSAATSSTTPTTTPTTPSTPTTPTATIPATNGDLWKEQFFAPYVDMGQYPVPDLAGLARKYGVGLFTLGFMQASPTGKLAWGGYDVLTLDSSNEQAVAIRNTISSLRTAGGDVMVSLGGAAGQSLAQYYQQKGLGAAALATAYGSMVDTLKLNKVDFDIEGAAVAEPQTLKLQMDAIALVQKTRPALGVWLTLPVLPQGLTADGVNVVKAALVAGVKVDGVNVMAMDYGDSAAPPAVKSMGEYAIDAANATFAQMTTLFTAQGQTFGWNQLGVTPMIGVNDVTSEVFTLQDADRLETFARAKGLGMIAMWSANRDNPGPAGQLSNTACGIPSLPAGGFSIAWGDYGSDPVIAGAANPVALPGITIGDVSVAEGNPQTGATTPLTFTVSLSTASTQPVTVGYATANGTAVAGSDYTAASGTLSFAPGETQKQVTVLVTRDTTAEANETFTVTLANPTNATLAKGVATGTILDDDTVVPTPTPTPTPAPAPTGTVAVKYSQVSSWSTGFTGLLAIKNTGTTAIKGWTLEFDLKANIVSIWNAVIVSHVGNHYVIKNADWNGTIAAGAEISVGFQADGIAGELPSNKKFNGLAV